MAVDFWGYLYRFRASTALILTILCGLSITLTACSPRDREVLSAAERACVNDRSKCFRASNNNNVNDFSGNGRSTNQRISFPDNVDGVATNYLIEREEQTLSYLRLVDDIVSGHIDTGDCFVVTELEPTGSERNFYLESRYPFCFSKSATGEVRQRGRLKLTLLQNQNGKVQSLKVFSEVLHDGSSSLKYQVFRNGSKRSIEVSDHFSIHLFRKGGEALHVGDFRSVAQISVMDFNQLKETHVVEFQSWGDYQIGEQDSKTMLFPRLDSALKYQGQVVGGSSSWWNASLKATKAQGPSIQVPQQEWAECGETRGSRELQFDFLKDQSRFKNIVNYSSSEIEITDPKGQSGDLKIKRNSCVKSKDKNVVWYGVLGISWSDFFPAEKKR